MKLVSTRSISLYEIDTEGRVKMASVPPGEYELDVIKNPVDPMRGGSWYQLRGTPFGAGDTWIEEMGHDPEKTGVRIIGSKIPEKSDKKDKKK